MQLAAKSRRRGKIASGLAAATCSLLCAAQGASLAAAEKEKSWSFDTALQYYGESDRVTDTSANVLARRSWADGRTLVLKLGVDTLTGASASGAAPSRSVQTFTGPSGGSYVIAPGETPLDPTFLDTRVALSANYSHPLGDRMRASYGASVSSEYDYFHAGANGSLSWDFNQRNTTLNLGLAFANDTIDPVGGAPIGLAEMLVPGNNSNKLADDSKTVTDLLVGVTHVLDKRTVGQLNYSLSHSSGYLTDPYKLISVVDPVTGDNVPGFGPIDLYLFESRPDSRTKHALYTHVRRQLRRDILDVSYRFMTDDWGVDSHTVDLHYRFKFNSFYLQPHLRVYTQTAADFYAPLLFDGAPLPEHATADYRMGDLDGMTYGLKYGRPLGGGREWSLRLEYYLQSGSSPPEFSVGSLQGLELFPDVEALIFQGGYRF